MTWWNRKAWGKGATKVTAPKPLVTSSSECEPALCTLRPRPQKRHTKWELRSTSKYINYLKYGTDSSTENEVKPKNKKPRVGKWPSTTHEWSQVMITRSHLNINMPKHMTIKLIGTAISPKSIVKSEDSKYKIVFKTEMSIEKHFQCKPVPSSKHAKIPQDMTQKHGPNFLLDNWDVENYKQYDTTAAETSNPTIIHPSSKTCSKHYAPRVATKPSTVQDEDSMPLPVPTSIITGGNIVHPSGRLCSKPSKQSHPDKNEHTKLTHSNRTSELKVAQPE